MGNRILAVDDNQVNLKVVTAALSHAGYEVITAQSGTAALELVEKVRPDVIILDIAMPEMDGYEVCRRLRANPATMHIPIMMLTAHDTLEEKIKGFDVGADEYLTKPFQPVELQARVKALARRMPAPVAAQVSATRGKMIGVFSLRGGVGVSTVATNLAVSFAQIWKKPVALIDLVLTMGQTALFMNLPLRNTWSDLAKIQLENVDAEVLPHLMLKHSSGVSVLASPRRPEEYELVSDALVKRTLELAAEQFVYTILDMPHDLSATTLMGLDLMDELVAVMTPDLASVRAMAATLDVFDRLGYPRKRTHVVLNWVFERRGLARKDIEAALKHPVQLVIPFSSDLIVPSINTGIPVMMAGSSCPLCGLYEDFAFLLSRPEDQKARPENASDAWKRAASHAGIKT